MRLFYRAYRKARGVALRYSINLCGGQCGEGLEVAFGACFVHPAHRGIKIGRNVLIGRGVCVEVPAGAQLTLGDDVKLTRDIIISVAREITIDSDSIVAEYVSIRDHDHGMALGTPIRLQPVVAAPIRIGRDVWIARGVAVLKGVEIGDGAVVGANAVVTSDLPAGAVCAGVPARVLRQRGEQQ